MKPLSKAGAVDFFPPKGLQGSQPSLWFQGMVVVLKILQLIWAWFWVVLEMPPVVVQGVPRWCSLAVVMLSYHVCCCGYHMFFSWNFSHKRNIGSIDPISRMIIVNDSNYCLLDQTNANNKNDKNDNNNITVIVVIIVKVRIRIIIVGRAWNYSLVP